VALAASQLGSAVKSEALKLTGRAQEPYVTRREKSTANAAALEDNKVVAILA